MKNNIFKMAIACFASGVFLSGCSKAPEQSNTLDVSGFNSADSLYSEPYIDIDEMRTEPSAHRYVHGGFTGTNARFSFYFPEKEQYQGRFYQYVTPVPDSETLSQGQSGESDKIAFSFDSGAYYVETNSGGPIAPEKIATTDPTIGAFRANAASAELSRVVAQQIYGEGRPYGYVFGGSGGAFRTVASVENTDAWDGSVPFVLGSPMSLPNVFTARTYGLRVLANKFPQVADVLDVGSQNTLEQILTEEELKAYSEVTAMGFPPAGWQLYDKLGLHAFAVIYPIVLQIDPSYFEDFWTKPGYEGFDGSESLTKSQFSESFTIAELITAKAAAAQGLVVGSLAGQPAGRADDAWKAQQAHDKAELPVAIRLDRTPDHSVLGADLQVSSGAALGATIIVTRPQGDIVMLDNQQAQLLKDANVGDSVEINNRRFLAVQTYHRHQVPDTGFPVWDQFRDEQGQPMYPQRPILGPILARGATGTMQSGIFHGKMILVENLHDTEAFAWQGDWYRSLAHSQLGEGLDDRFRIYMNDRTNHGDFTKQTDATHTVSYIGILQQALRDVSLWVEQGIEPPESSQYQVINGQVIVADQAAKRHGIQPVIELKANGTLRAEVDVDEAVELAAVINVPPGAGSVVSAEWDLDGTGEFKTLAELTFVDETKAIAEVALSTEFDQPGTFFPVLRVASQREGDAETPFARVQNLARVRVVVQ